MSARHFRVATVFGLVFDASVCVLLFGRSVFWRDGIREYRALGKREEGRQAPILPTSIEYSIHRI